MSSNRRPYNAWVAQKYRNLSPTPTTLNRRVDAYKRVQSTNALNQTTFTGSLVRTVWAQIVPMTGSMAWQQTETILADTTHRVTARYAAMKDMAVGDYLMYEGRRFDIQFILNPFESNWMLEFYCQEMKDT